MKKISAILLLLLAAGAILQACKKQEEKVKLDEKTEQFNADANNVKGELDNADNDINTSLNETSMGGRVSSTYSSPLCGVTIDSSQIANKILFYNFDGTTPCFSPSRTRAGQIKVELISGNHWRDVGAVLKMDFINYKIVRLSDNKSIKINGTKTLTNVNGINWFTFLTSTSSFKFRERALNINVEFDNGQQATWNSARLTQWDFLSATAVPGIPYAHVKFTSNGDTAIGNATNLDSWGLNRYGQQFHTRYTAPWVSNSYCGFWRPVSGTLVHYVNNGNYTLSLGVDQSGNASTLSCAYGFKVEWTPAGGSPQTVIRSY